MGKFSLLFLCILAFSSCKKKELTYEQKQYVDSMKFEQKVRYQTCLGTRSDNIHWQIFCIRQNLEECK